MKGHASVHLMGLSIASEATKAAAALAVMALQWQNRSFHGKQFLRRGRGGRRKCQTTTSQSQAEAHSSVAGQTDFENASER